MFCYKNSILLSSLADQQNLIKFTSSIFRFQFLLQKPFLILYPPIKLTLQYLSENRKLTSLQLATGYLLSAGRKHRHNRRKEKDGSHRGHVH